MTLVIVGHEQVEDGYGSVWRKDNDSKEITLRSEGLFAVADSIITVTGSNGDTPLLSGLRKIYPIPIKLWKPSFLDVYFNGYFETYIESSCFVAFAGSTLTATHALNLISDHLCNLQISYKFNRGEYIVQRHCETNVLSDSKNAIWDKHMFLDRYFQKLLTAQYIAEVIEHSINTALKSAQKYRLSKDEINKMHTDFAAGIHCPTTGQHFLFLYRMQITQKEDLVEVYTKREEIKSDTVAVLGMRSEFEERAQKKYFEALKSGSSTGKEMFKFLNDSIKEVSSKGKFSIDKPSFHMKFEDGLLEKINFEY